MPVRMARWHARLSPLRLWLQSSSLLAVLAGYSLLLLFNQQLAGVQRQAAHRALVDQLVAELQSLESLPQAPLLPGLRLRLLPRRSSEPSPAPAAVVQASDQQWLVSSAPVLLAHGRRATLQVEQNVTASVQQEWQAFWLLVAAAGVSSLFTSGLLRLVLQRGLVRPLAEFTSQLSTTQAPPTPANAIEVAAQPEELRPIAEAFNALQQRLAVSWERQRSFVDGVAHELRTPITLISGHTQRLLRRHPHDPALQLIHAEARRMGSLVGDLLDLARQDSGRLNLRTQLIVGEDALLTLYERMAPHASGRLRLELPASAAPPAQGLADPDRLQQCLTALVDNALQYSPAGSPVQLACSSGPAAELVLHVQDQGPGVPQHERERIFERFVRGSAAQASAQRGSGIGLSVVKLLIEAMGGAVRVADAPGGGANVQLWLPAVTASAAPPSA